MANNSKKGNYENLKFLAVLAAIFIIILVIYFISKGSEAKNPPLVIGDTPTPTSEIKDTPGPIKVTDTPIPSVSVEPTGTPTANPVSETPTPTGAEVTGGPTSTPTEAPVAPTPIVAIKSSEAKKALETIVNPAQYSATLLSGSFSPNGDGEVYYRFAIKEIATGKQMQPDMLVHSITASVYCYQDGKVFDCVQFPLDSTEVGGSDIAGDREITAKEAVKILMTYGREQLQLPSDPSKYTANVEETPSVTLADADGIQAYLILLLDKDDKLMGAYAVSVNGVFVYIRDEWDPNAFVRITEG